MVANHRARGKVLLLSLGASSLLSQLPRQFLGSGGLQRGSQSLFFGRDIGVSRRSLASAAAGGSLRRSQIVSTVGAGLGATMAAAEGEALEVDPEYPGTSVKRLRAIHERVKTLSTADLSGDWEEVRRKLLWAGGLKDLPSSRPGQGYTGHSFNDDNHCDLTPMLGEVAHNENQGNIRGIALGNRLGPGIEVASLPELGSGGSWSTCTNGCHLDPPQDVAHVQFRSRIAFKLVWCPPAFKSFVLVDDDGNLLAAGTPTGDVPDIRYRKSNYGLTQGGKYAKEAEKYGAMTA